MFKMWLSVEWRTQFLYLTSNDLKMGSYYISREMVKWSQLFFKYYNIYMYFLYLILKLNTLCNIVWLFLPSEKAPQKK